MKNDVRDKIPAVLLRQAMKIQQYDLFDMGKNCQLQRWALLAMLVSAAFFGQSLEERAQNDRNFTSDALYHHLNNKVSIESAENMLNYFVKRRDIILLRRRFNRWGFYVAIDFTEEMFYGDKKTEGVVGTQHKKGTNYAFRYMTVNIVTPKGRFLIWTYPMLDRKETLWLLNKALMKIEELGIRVHVLLLDREFNSTDVLALIGEKYKYITPADQDGKFLRHTKGRKCPAYCDDWRVANKNKEEISTQLVVLQEGGHKYGYLTNMPKCEFEKEVEILSKIYGMRWGIETAHRCEDKFRIPTSCKTAQVRYLFFVVGVLMYNLWVWINLFFNFSASGQHITLAGMKNMLREAFEAFWLWLKNPQRWFSLPSLQNVKRGYFACFGRLRLPIGSADALR